MDLFRFLAKNNNELLGAASMEITPIWKHLPSIHWWSGFGVRERLLFIMERIYCLSLHSFKGGPILERFPLLRRQCPVCKSAEEYVFTLTVISATIIVVLEEHANSKAFILTIHQMHPFRASALIQEGL